MRASIPAVVVAALLVFPGSKSGGQAITPAGAQRATRAELAQRATEVERALTDTRLKRESRGRLTEELTALRNRLEIGDFHVGDRFLITMRRDSTRSDTASVRDSLKVAVFSLPDISLRGVLRSELDERMSAHVARYLRGVSVRTSALTRVAILGAVRNPGYFYASPDRPVSDLVMLAGGPNPDANLKQLEVSRGGKVLLRAKESSRLVKDGRTLEQIDIQSGDEVRIPEKRKLSFQSILQLAFVVSSLFFAALQFLMWYYNRKDG
ncbi:MAG: SLBB domain-containing protein [Gemmatimonadaceae bacterium]|nr:SLBB domain-containing protein [Gemmatimonadaceae bacterium]